MVAVQRKEVLVRVNMEYCFLIYSANIAIRRKDLTVRLSKKKKKASLLINCDLGQVT